MSFLTVKKQESRPIDRLINLYPSMRDASKSLGVSRQLLEIWMRKGFIPFARGEYIEQKTNGKITRHEIWESAGKKS